jgi:hypothetical protein
MSFRLLGIAAAAAVTTLATVAPAAAGCWSCGCAPAYTYVQPRVVYVQPPCAAYYQRPVYVVNQGPTYTQPVPPEAMPSPYVHHRARPYPYGASMPYWRHHYRHHRHHVRGHFYRAHRVHAPMFRPHRVHGPRVVHVPKRMVVPHRAHPVHAPMPRHMHQGHGPKHHGQTPRRRHQQP